MFNTVEALHDNITNKGFYPLTHEQAVIGNDEVDLETKLKKINKDISKSVIDYSKEYLTTEALENGTISFIISSGINTNLLKSISYSIDNGTTWTTINNEDNKEDDIQIDINVSEGNKVLWKGNGLALSDYIDNVSGFVSDIQINVYGNIMSLLYGDNFINQTSLSDVGRNFYDLFATDINAGIYIVNASNLILPATTLTNNCYESMFNGCGSLTTAPELPATTLAPACYNAMFQDCTSLTIAPELPATILANGCYNGMFYNCKSLTIAPELPSTILVNGCYHSMFRGCTLLNYIKCLATDISESNCINYWVSDIATTGTFIKADSMTSWTTGNDGIPTGWTIINNSDTKNVDVKYYNDNFKSKFLEIKNKYKLTGIWGNGASGLVDSYDVFKEKLYLCDSDNIVLHIRALYLVQNANNNIDVYQGLLFLGNINGNDTSQRDIPETGQTTETTVYTFRGIMTNNDDEGGLGTAKVTLVTVKNTSTSEIISKSITSSFSIKNFLVSNDITTQYTISVVNEMPASPDNNVIYIVR